MAVRAFAAVCCLLAGLLSSSAFALPPPKAEKMVKAARKLTGTPYNFGGRLRKSGPGIDCQGVIFAAAESVQRCGWKSFSVMPTQTVRDGELGQPVKGLSPIRSSKLDVKLLEPGDIVFLVSSTKNPAEEAIAFLEGRPVWVWHTGMATGEGQWIVGDHFAGEVIEVPLADYLAEHRGYEGVYVLRMEHGPAPKNCRTHPAMGALKASTSKR